MRTRDQTRSRPRTRLQKLYNVLEAGCECVDDEDVQVLSTVFPARVGILYYLLRIVDSHMSAHHVRCVDVFVIGNCRGTGESHRYRDA